VLKVKGLKKEPDVHNTVCDSIAKRDKTLAACLRERQRERDRGRERALLG